MALESDITTTFFPVAPLDGSRDSFHGRIELQCKSVGSCLAASTSSHIHRDIMVFAVYTRVTVV